MTLLEDPHHHAERGRQRQRVHHDGLDRQHHRAEGQEQQHERGQADDQRHPRQGVAQAGQLVDQLGSHAAHVDVTARRGRHRAHRRNQLPRCYRGRICCITQVQPRGVAAEPGDLGRRDTWDVCQALLVRGERGSLGRCRDRAVQPGEHLDRAGWVAGEVLVQCLGHHPGRGTGGQRPGVGAAPGDVPERGGQREQRDHDHHGVDGRPPHHAASQPVPGAALLAAGRAGRGAAHPQRVHPGAEHGQQRGQHGERGQHVHQHGGHPAIAHRAEEGLREQHQPGQRHRHGDPGHRDGAARRGHRGGHRVLRRRLPVQFLTEPADHEQAVVDGQAQAEDRGDVDRVDGHPGDQGEQPQRGERAEDADAADGQRQAGRGQAAEDH